MMNYFKKFIKINYKGSLFVVFYPFLNFLEKIRRGNFSYSVSLSSLVINCCVGKKVVFYDGVFFKDSKIGDYSFVARQSNISNAKIGRFCSIGPNCSIGLGFHPTHLFSTSPSFYSSKSANFTSFLKDESVIEHKSVVIGNDVWIGSGVTILDGVTIGDGVVIGAGSIVTHDVDSYSIIVGVPAKKIKERFGTVCKDYLVKINWWTEYSQEYSLLRKDFNKLRGFEK